MRTREITTEKHPTHNEIGVKVLPKTVLTPKEYGQKVRNRNPRIKKKKFWSHPLGVSITLFSYI